MTEAGREPERIRETWTKEDPAYRGSERWAHDLDESQWPAEYRRAIDAWDTARIERNKLYEQPMTPGGEPR